MKIRENRTRRLRTTKVMEGMLKSKEKRYEFIRFCVVGVVASGLHYGAYYLLQTKIDVNVAYTVGYLISLICNFFLTSYLTFHSSPSIRKALGFGGSHLINYLIHLSFLNLFLYLGISKVLAPVLVLAIAVPINFILLRWVFKHKNK